MDFRSLTTTIILTYNEEVHIERCIRSALNVSKRIIIIDSFSTDNTIKIAKKYGCDVYQNVWENSYAKQFNWGLLNGRIETDWILRLDADEYLSEKAITFFKNQLNAVNSNISGVYFNRRIIFLGKEILFGGKNKEWQLRLFRFKRGFCEKRWMDEHIKIVHGDSIKVPVKFFDNNLNSISWWINKHNNYAIREALDILNENYLFKIDSSLEINGKIFASQAERKRSLKSIYNKLPRYFRAFLYFSFRYFILFGFLDGTKGFVFHFMQGFWYRLLVDVNVFEIERDGEYDKEKIARIFTCKYGITMEL